MTKQCLWRQATIAALFLLTASITRLPAQPLTPRAYLPFTQSNYVYTYSKRGSIVGDCTDFNILHITWTYGYAPSANNCAGIENVPMIRDASQLPVTSLGGNSDWLMGFNEPDGAEPSGSNLTPTQAALLWPQLEATGRELLSPAPISYPSTWLIDFRAAYYTQFGVYPRLDALAIHCYAALASTCETVIQAGINQATQWNIPAVWVSEFGLPYQCGTSSAVTETQNLLNWLDAQPVVTRYAWFPAHVDLPQPWWPPDWCDDSLVDVNYKLTAYGLVYAQ